MKRTTIKDVAKASGVSPATVSRVLSGKVSVSDDIANRVKETVTGLGYRPSVMARSLTSARTGLIALVVGSLRNPFDAELVQRLSRRIYASGKRLLMIPADYGGNDPAAMVALDYQTDGVIVVAGHICKEAGEHFSKIGVPVILFGREFNASGVDCIVADNIAGTYSAGRLFSQSGAKHVSFIRHKRSTFSDDERYAGLIKGLGEGICYSSISCKTRDARDAALALLSRDNRPDAILGANDVLAFGAIEAAAILGLQVPDELSVIGFDDIPAASSPFFNLTTLRQSTSHISDWIVSRLEARMAQPEISITTFRVPVQIIVRRSTVFHASLLANGFQMTPKGIQQ